MAKAKVTLYLDTASPFAYMGFYALKVSGCSSTNELFVLEDGPS
jgi:hypothetical protein